MAEDVNEVAFRVISEFVGDASPVESTKNAAAVSLGRLGGLKGGKARAKSLTPERRREIAQNAAKARWERLREEQGASGLNATPLAP